MVTDYVVLNWDAPVDNGSPITSYQVFIRKSDLSYIEDPTVCDGARLDTIQSTSCNVPLSVLTAQPYNLLLGYKIYMKVIATNAYGDSLISEPGSNDGIELVPDAPINLQNNPAITSDSVIGISWSDGPSDGDA